MEIYFILYILKKYVTTSPHTIYFNHIHGQVFWNSQDVRVLLKQENKSALYLLTMQFILAYIPLPVYDTYLFVQFMK